MKPLLITLAVLIPVTSFIGIGVVAGRDRPEAVRYIGRQDDLAMFSVRIPDRWCLMVIPQGRKYKATDFKIDCAK